jgi:hypothetical protein
MIGWGTIPPVCMAGRLTLKIYTKGERALRIEAVAHDTAELDCGRALERFPRIVTELHR